MWGPSEVVSVAVRSQSSSHGSCLDSLVWCHSVDYSVRSVVIFDLIRDQFASHVTVVRYPVRHCFGNRICFRSAWIWLVCLWCICRYTGCPSYARWTYLLRLQGALAGSPPGVLVDSSVGVFAITSLGSVDLLSFSESTSRFMSRYICRCEHSQLVNGSYGASFLHFRDCNCLR